MTLPTGTNTFTGQIAGLGFEDGTRVVVGRWTASPLGAFTDVMVERGDGHRVLLAPSVEIADVVSDLYRFDQVEVVPVTARTEGRALTVEAGSLRLELTVGDRTPLGRALAAVPGTLARKAWWSRVTDPVAQAVLDGVRTRGRTADGYDVTYGATDLHAITWATATWEGRDLGALGPLEPPVRFGFGSTPSEPTLTGITTTIQVTEDVPLTGVIDSWGMDAQRAARLRALHESARRHGVE